VSTLAGSFRDGAFLPGFRPGEDGAAPTVCSMVLTFTARDLLLASWWVSPERVARGLPRALEPALADGRALVSIATLRCEDVRLGSRRAPSFSQLSVRTYVVRDGEPGVFFLSLRVTPPGLGGVLFGAPFRPASIRVREGLAEARGLGVSFAYRAGGLPSVPFVDEVALGSHQTGYVVSAGLRRLAAGHEPFAWEAAELTAEPRLDPVLALGFDVKEPDSLLYARSTCFRADLPLARVA
jgi:hypothetical protein